MAPTKAQFVVWTAVPVASPERTNARMGLTGALVSKVARVWIVTVPNRVRAAITLAATPAMTLAPRQRSPSSLTFAVIPALIPAQSPLRSSHDLHSTGAGYVVHDLAGRL